MVPWVRKVGIFGSMVVIREDNLLEVAITGISNKKNQVQL
jgi:hypothetical protein